MEAPLTAISSYLSTFIPVELETKKINNTLLILPVLCSFTVENHRHAGGASCQRGAAQMSPSI